MEREQKINDIMGLIGSSAMKYDVLVVAAMANLNISNRTAKEYISVALYKLKIKKEDL